MNYDHHMMLTSCGVKLEYGTMFGTTISDQHGLVWRLEVEEHQQTSLLAIERYSK